tara:strand:- start:1325 stop:1561 length:237 start_codon:yes stop_codon:yes gene_type:complete
MKNIKQLLKLTNQAIDLLDLAEQSQHKYESMLKCNIETLAPLGLELHSDESIEFQMKVTNRIMGSYFRVINEIKAFEL